MNPMNPINIDDLFQNLFGMSGGMMGGMNNGMMGGGGMHDINNMPSGGEYSYFFVMVCL